LFLIEACMSLPMLADFAVRLTGGLAAMLLATPWRVVPPAFFRTQCLVVLGLFVLAALDQGRIAGDRLALGVTIGAGLCAYLGSIGWGLGIRRLGAPFTVLMAAAALFVMGWVPRRLPSYLWALDVAGSASSAFLMGSALTAMLLGHNYLTAPAMSIDPLKRSVKLMAIALVMRAVLAAIGLGAWAAGRMPSSSAVLSPLFLGMRWGMGLVAPALAAWMAWKTVEIRSTQSATGILYIAMILLLVGELTAMILARDAGIVM
jgi:hypothetical protein